MHTVTAYDAEGGIAFHDVYLTKGAAAKRFQRLASESACVQLFKGIELVREVVGDQECDVSVAAQG